MAKTYTVDDFNIGDRFIVKNNIYYKKIFVVKAKTGNQIHCDVEGDKSSIQCFQNENLGYYSNKIQFLEKVQV